MSANTTIAEGGKGYLFGPVKCLMVEGDNGEFYPWYPEADRALDSLSVDKNGTYQASKYGVYGWNRVSINVPGSVTGRDPQTGQEVTVTADPETGELVETVVPTEIRVTTMPTKTDYIDGETIDYSGIVVHAYSSTGQDMGAVPFNELVFPVSTADAQSVYPPTPESGVYPGNRTDYENVYDTIFVDSGDNSPLNIINSSDYYYTTYYNNGMLWALNETTCESGLRSIWFNCKYDDPSNGHYDRLLVLAGKNHFQGNHHYVNYYYGEDSNTPWNSAEEIQGGISYYFASIAFTATDHITIQGNNLQEGRNVTNETASELGRIQRVVAWMLFNSYQEINVNWPRPGDGAVLETSFNITVTGGT